MKRKLTTGLMLMISFSVFAQDVAQDLNTFFEGIGVASNVTQAQAIQTARIDNKINQEIFCIKLFYFFSTSNFFFYSKL